MLCDRGETQLLPLLVSPKTIQSLKTPEIDVKIRSLVIVAKTKSLRGFGKLSVSTCVCVDCLAEAERPLQRLQNSEDAASFHGLQQRFRKLIFIFPPSRLAKCL